jgi:hypothetical protein
VTRESPPVVRDSKNEQRTRQPDKNRDDSLKSQVNISFALKKVLFASLLSLGFTFVASILRLRGLRLSGFLGMIRGEAVRAPRMLSQERGRLIRLPFLWATCPRLAVRGSFVTYSKSWAQLLKWSEWTQCLSVLSNLTLQRLCKPFCVPKMSSLMEFLSPFDLGYVNVIYAVNLHDMKN